MCESLLRTDPDFAETGKWHRSIRRNKARLKQPRSFILGELPILATEPWWAYLQVMEIAAGNYRQEVHNATGATGMPAGAARAAADSRVYFLRYFLGLIGHSMVT